MSTRGTSQWQYKINAMKMLAAAVRGAINPAAIGSVTIIPIPPSKVRTDPEYGPRMAVIAKTVVQDAREAIEPVASRCPLHESQQRMKPDEMFATLTLRQTLCQPVPTDIILLDDVITTGCSFVACHRLLREQFPTVPISGIFAARRVIDRSSEFGVIDLG